ncbi:HAAS signaling domain-containing protein [Oryzihumus leptocrescens]|uniref:DUF1700 domain-containing protein n=1 Tax=Oryzihumus leptocrescens TaxID=297536 RepID=A0A542ZM51_9MICO|nr:hypothetical protein [Oryzihumus leptocrescens]TQL61411.1 hypothetical protein FB474_2820 [Oryzihumus leptocrescens]
MSTPSAEDLVLDYLSRLEAAASHLPPERRVELVEEIRSHIDAARESGEARDPAAVRNLLDRLGSPEEIAAAAAPDRRRGEVRPGLLHEYATVATLLLGSILLPVIGWLCGVALLWTSRQWTTREKLLGTLVVPGGPGGVWLASALPTQNCSESSGGSPSGPETITRACSGFAFPPLVGIPLAIVTLVASFVVPAVLLSRARKRAGRTPRLDTSGASAPS